MPTAALDDLLEHLRWAFGSDDPSILDWTGSMRVRPKVTDPPARDARPDAPARNTVVFGPAGERLAHPDGSVELVVLGADPPAARLAEACRVARDAVVVWAADGSAAVAWRRESAPPDPEVTIVVVARGDAAALDACLVAVARTTPTTPAIEVVVVDAGPTGPDLAAVDAACAAARGEGLVLLDERTRVGAGWLRPLLRILREDQDVGVVGGCSVDGSGAVTEAGGVLFSDATTVGFGHGLAAGAPLVGGVRDVTFVSAGLLATRTALLRTLGGLDPDLDPEHVDVDLCLRVRAAGRRVLVTPQSVAVGPGRPPGGPSSAGRERLRRRWATHLATLPAAPGAFDDAVWDRLARRP